MSIPFKSRVTTIKIGFGRKRKRPPTQKPRSEKMPEFAFDVKLWAVARVTADTEKEAREKLSEVVDCVDLSGTPGTVDHGVTLTEASAEGEYDLIEIDGEAV